MTVLTHQERENRLWFKIVKRLGAREVARRIARLPSYRKYVQRYPFDGAETPLSLNYIMPNAQGQKGSTAVIDILPDPTQPMEEEYAGSEFNSEFKSTLTKRQLRILELLEQGYKPKDIYKRFGYKNTGGVRYIKWAVRQKYIKFQLEQKQEAAIC